MSLPALIGFAGVLVAAVGTGLLAGRAVRQPRMDCVLWAAAALALTVALAAQSVGFASGFGAATFRAVQLSGLLLAPLWLAWGLAELTWPGEAARFGARLACYALTIVGSVILATDPLAAAPFGKDWPLAGAHYQQPSHYALLAVQGVAVILTMASLGVLAAEPRNGRPWLGTAAVALAVLLTVAMRFSLPGRPAYPLLILAAAAAAWFGANRLDAALNRSGRGRDRRAAGAPAAALAGEPGPEYGPRPYAAYGHGDPAGSRRPVRDQARAPGDLGRRPDGDRWPPVPSRLSRQPVPVRPG